MKKLIIVILAVALAASAGWWSFSRSAGKATITIDTQKVKSDTEGAVNAGKKLLDQAGKGIKEELKVPPSSSDNNRGSH